jgi:hypothetical protein
MAFEQIEKFAKLYEEFLGYGVDRATEKKILDDAIKVQKEDPDYKHYLNFVCMKLAYRVKKEYLNNALRENGKPSFTTYALLQLVKSKANRLEEEKVKEKYRKLLKEIETLIEESTTSTIYLFEKKEKNE